MTPAEALTRLVDVHLEMRQAAALGLTRELAAWAIAVEVLDELSRPAATHPGRRTADGPCPNQDVAGQ